MNKCAQKLSLFLRENDNYLILTHEHPDGDAFGSVFGLLTVLWENGKKADAFFPDAIPLRYQNFIPDGLIIGKLPDLSPYSWLICLDFSSPERVALGNDDKTVISSFQTANIDHHPDNKLFGVRNFVDTKASATAEILYRAIKNIKGWQIPRKAATCFLIGIVMDTGGFRFDNTTPAVFNISAELLKSGAEYSKIINEMFFSKPLAFARLEAELLQRHLHTACSGRYIWIYLTEEILKSHGVLKKETEGLIDILRMLRGVDIVCIFHKEDKGFHFSLRSKNTKYSVGKIARSLNGGGHELAAGGFIKTGAITEAEKIMLSYVRKELGIKS